MTSNGSTSSWQVLVIDIAQVNKAQLVGTVLSTDGANKAVYAIAFSTTGLYYARGSINSGTTGYTKYIIHDCIVSSNGSLTNVVSTVQKAMYNSTDFIIHTGTTDSQLTNKLQYHTNAELANVSYVINLTITAKHYYIKHITIISIGAILTFS